MLLVLPEAHFRSLLNAVAPRWRQLSSLTTWLPSSQIAVKVADTSLRNEQIFSSVTCVSLLSLRQPRHTWPARSPHLASVPQASWTQLSSQRCNPKFFASATDVQVISNDACAELKSCSWDKIVLSSCAYAGQSGSLLIHLVYVVLRLASPDCHSHLELAREAVALSILMPSISVCVSMCSLVVLSGSFAVSSLPNVE